MRHYRIDVTEEQFRHLAQGLDVAVRHAGLQFAREAAGLMNAMDAAETYFPEPPTVAAPAVPKKRRRKSAPTTNEA